MKTEILTVIRLSRATILLNCLGSGLIPTEAIELKLKHLETEMNLTREELIEQVKQFNQDRGIVGTNISSLHNEKPQLTLIKGDLYE